MFDEWLMFDAEAIRTRVFADCVRLCRLPEWKDWAWCEVKRLDKEELFRGIEAYVLEEIKNETCSKS
jgi:hypothetical protein